MEYPGLRRGFVPLNALRYFIPRPDPAIMLDALQRGFLRLDSQRWVRGLVCCALCAMCACLLMQPAHRQAGSEQCVLHVPEPVISGVSAILRRRPELDSEASAALFKKDMLEVWAPLLRGQLRARHSRAAATGRGA